MKHWLLIPFNSFQSSISINIINLINITKGSSKPITFSSLQVQPMYCISIPIILPRILNWPTSWYVHPCSNYLSLSHLKPRMKQEYICLHQCTRFFLFNAIEQWTNLSMSIPLNINGITTRFDSLTAANLLLLCCFVFPNASITPVGFLSLLFQAK